MSRHYVYRYCGKNVVPDVLIPRHARPTVSQNMTDATRMAFQHPHGAPF
eukprot:SAG11_NODE_723_length_7528_cov_4.998385_3_plen_49_part_00